MALFFCLCGAERERPHSATARLEEERKVAKGNYGKTGVASGAKWNSIFELRFFKEQLRVEV